jgi:outer membrane receptor protein involved in Fe transport
MNRLLRILMLGVMFASSTVQIRAEAPTGAEELFFMDLPVVFAATKTSTSVKKIPNKVVVVTEKDIKRRNYRYLGDVISDLPGFQDFKRQNMEVLTEVLVRGVFQNNKIVVLHNGQRINSPTNRPFAYGDWVSMANVRKVEVIYGPASALWGADAVSALINIETKDFEDQPTQVDVAVGAENTDISKALKVNSVKEGSLGTRFQAGDLKLSLFADYHYTGGPDFLKDYPEVYEAALTNPSYAARGAYPGFRAPSQTYQVQADAKLWDKVRLSYVRFMSEQNSAFGQSPGGFSIQKDNVFRWTQDNISLSGDLALSDKLTLKNNMFYNWWEIDPKSQIINDFFTGGVSFTKEDFKYGRAMRFGFTEELLYKTEKTQSLLGYEFNKIYALEKISTTTGFKADPNLPINYLTNPNIPNGEVAYNRYGVYGQTQYDVTKDISLIAGLRYDKVWDFAHSLNPRVGATWQATDRLNLKAQYAQATLTPSMFYRFENFSNNTFPAAGSAGAVPNLNVKPEKYQTGEVGALYEFSNKLSLEGSAYYNVVKDYILWHRFAQQPFTYVAQYGHNPGYTANGANFISINVNGGEMVTYGGELGLKAKMFDRLDGTLDYSVVNGYLTEKANPILAGQTPFEKAPLPLSAMHTVKAGVDTKVTESFHVLPSLTWIGSRRLRPDHLLRPANSFNGYALYNLSLSYEMASLRFWGLVENLTNNSYYTPSGTAGGFDGARQPQDRRTWKVGASYKFGDR